MAEKEGNILNPDAWVDNFADYLYNYAVVRLSNEEQAADLVQDTFLSAYKAKNSFKGGSSEKTWLTSILRRKIIDVYRKRSTTRESPMSDYENAINDTDFYRAEEPFLGHWKDDAGPHSNSLMPEGELENSELREILEKCISLLPEKLASVFILKMIDEASSDEICKDLDITPSNIWVMMHRARLKLRKCLESNWI